MKTEGMVHALQEIHRLLSPEGCLIDIHPAVAPTLIEVHHRGAISFAIPVPDQTFEDIKHADEAIKEVVRRGDFTIDRTEAFEWRTYASSRIELRDYIIEESAYDDYPSHEVLALENDSIAKQVDAFMQAGGHQASVARMNLTRIARLLPVR